MPRLSCSFMLAANTNKKSNVSYLESACSTNVFECQNATNYTIKFATATVTCCPSLISPKFVTREIHLEIFENQLKN